MCIYICVSKVIYVQKRPKFCCRFISLQRFTDFLNLKGSKIVPESEEKKTHPLIGCWKASKSLTNLSKCITKFQKC